MTGRVVMGSTSQRFGWSGGRSRTRTCDRSENNRRTHQSAQVRCDLLIHGFGSAPVRTSQRGFSAGKVSADLGLTGGAR